MPVDANALKSWRWEAACIIRGPGDAPKFKDHSLPLIFLKRLFDFNATQAGQRILDDESKLAVVLDTRAVSRDSGNQGRTARSRGGI